MPLSLLQSEVDGDFSQAYETYGYYSQADFQLLGKTCDLPAKAITKTIEKMLEAIEREKGQSPFAFYQSPR